LLLRGRSFDDRARIAKDECLFRWFLFHEKPLVGVRVFFHRSRLGGAEPSGVSFAGAVGPGGVAALLISLRGNVKGRSHDEGHAAELSVILAPADADDALERIVGGEQDIVRTKPRSNGLCPAGGRYCGGK